MLEQPNLNSLESVRRERLKVEMDEKLTPEKRAARIVELDARKKEIERRDRKPGATR